MDTHKEKECLPCCACVADTYSRLIEDRRQALPRRASLPQIDFWRVTVHTVLERGPGPNRNSTGISEQQPSTAVQHLSHRVTPQSAAHAPLNAKRLRGGEEYANLYCDGCADGSAERH